MDNSARSKKLKRQIYGMLGEKVGSYEMDEKLSWEERYKKLEEHHIKETEFLIETLIKWGIQIQDLDFMLSETQRRLEHYEKEDSTRL